MPFEPGMISSTLSEYDLPRDFSIPGLFGRTRSALLTTLYGHMAQLFYLRQLVRAVGAGHGAVQRELKYLTGMGLIVRTTQGNQVLYQANRQSPIFPRD